MTPPERSEHPAGPVREMQAILDALGDDLPAYVTEGATAGPA
jgi:hypothetical protein